MSKKKMRKKYKKWTTKDDEKLVSMYARRVKRADMARSMGRPVGTIDQRLHRMRKLGLHQDRIGTLQKYRKRKNVKDDFNQKVERQFNPVSDFESMKTVSDFESMKTIFNERYKEIEAKCREQRLIIKDAMEKLEVILGRLRWCLE